VLQKNGKDIWAFSGQAAWRALTSLGDSVQEMMLTQDSGDVDDGIRATRLIKGPHLVPGLAKTNGYASLSQMITDGFDVIPGHPEGDAAGNFYEFPYDWRRDNVVSARRLRDLVERQLPRWCDYSGARNAKVILIAHSMGGLVCRYYLEVLEGWRDCRALITFGTPFRGSVHALEFLSNGYKKLFVDLTEVMRSFPSVYQLLPIYKVVNVDGEYRRVADTESIPNVVRARVEKALGFHRQIEAEVARHMNDSRYRLEYKTLPVVGTRQDTLQSAELANGKLAAGSAPPEVLDPLLADGDGTVPHVSAIPIELSNEDRELFVPERHSSLQYNPTVLGNLLDRLKQMQASGISAVRGPEPRPLAQRPAIALDVEDFYPPTEPVDLHVRLVDAVEQPGAIVATIQRVSEDDGAQGGTQLAEFRESSDGWTLRLDGLAPGVYRIEVRTRRAGPAAPAPVHDLFEIGA
jgi:pimeloyl-ACP methyl ester carboxylesterase